MLELRSLSAEHEPSKKNIARFIGLYAYLKNIDLYGYGSTTFKQEVGPPGKLGGSPARGPTIPDLIAADESARCSE